MVTCSKGYFGTKTWVQMASTPRAHSMIRLVPSQLARGPTDIGIPWPGPAALAALIFCVLFYTDLCIVTDLGKLRGKIAPLVKGIIRDWGNQKRGLRTKRQAGGFSGQPAWWSKNVKNHLMQTETSRYAYILPIGPGKKQKIHHAHKNCIKFPCPVHVTLGQNTRQSQGLPIS